MSSDAIGQERISRVVGYKITKGNFAETSTNLPQRVAILGEANTANQATMDLEPTQFTSLQQIGAKYGYGSPIYLACRILFPVNGGGLGGIPVYVYPQAQASGATAKIIEVDVTGVATDNATHTIVVGGRYNLDGSSYDISIVKGDTQAQIHAKIEDAINNVLGSPVSCVSDDYVSTLTTKWAGLTAQGLVVSVDTNGKSAGLTYSVNTTQPGSATPSITSSLAQFGNIWNTIVVNTYGTVDSIMDALEAFNGVPDPENPTGRFVGNIMKPFIALTGSVADDPSSITDSREDQVTIAICPAPLSSGFPLEAAANMCLLFAVKEQNNPHLDVCGTSYKDMPTPTSIGSMGTYNNRDIIVKKGCSTVDLVAGKYQVQDFVTTYHPEGENPPQFRYCRNLMLDFNIRYKYFLLEQIYVVDKAITDDNTITTVSNVISPKDWKGILNTFADTLSLEGLIADPSFMKDSIAVNLSTTNPDRIETFFRYKRTGIARISATTAEAGFNFGIIN